MDNNEMTKVLNDFKTGKTKAYSISFKNESADTDDSIYIAPSYDMFDTDNGHPISGKGIGEQSFEVTTHPSNSLKNFTETIKHNKLELERVRFEADDAATLSAIDIDHTQRISMFSPKGIQESLQLSIHIDPNAENRNVVDVKNPPFDLCPTTKVLAKIPFGKTLKVTYFVKD